MRVLLDTHIWLWFLAGDPRLDRKWQAILEDEATDLWLSPISVWEALLLAQRGRIDCPPEPFTWMAQALRCLPVREAPLTTAIAVRSRVVDLAHEDPADRFLVATALELDLHFATVDQRLQDVVGLKLVR